MFYQPESIENFLTCCICEQKMVDPRLLPCDKSICNRCVDFWTDTEKKRVECQSCIKSHEIREEGFPQNQALKEILKSEAKEVLQSKQILEFKVHLDSFGSMKQSIELKLNSGDVQIRDECNKARNDIQLAIEQAKLKLDEIHKDLMDEIDQHEKQCQEKLK